jgi:hypothetical protein
MKMHIVRRERATGLLTDIVLLFRSLRGTTHTGQTAWKDAQLPIMQVFRTVHHPENPSLAILAISFKAANGDSRVKG